MHSCIKNEPDSTLIDQVQFYSGSSGDILNPMYEQHYQSTVAAAAHQYYSSMQQQYGPSSGYMAQNSPLSFYSGTNSGFNKSSGSYFPLAATNSYQSSNQNNLQYPNSYSSSYCAGSQSATFSSAQSSPSDFNGFNYGSDSPQYNYFSTQSSYSPYINSANNLNCTPSATYPITPFMTGIYYL